MLRPYKEHRSTMTQTDNSEWCVAAASGKRPAAARGLLLAAYRRADQVLDGIGCRIVPFFRERAATRLTG